ncbi:cytochrome P450 [Actinoalloteichus sp. AHMU CJ021]|uniref:cytochrome P450 n=1 Tax=Actinoalloteichus sp. AHMU CJ021 TaxID=2072503 RepID=UPI002697B0F0
MDPHRVRYPFPRPNPTEPPAELAWLRDTAPVCQVHLPDGSSAWLVSRYDDVRTVLTDPRFSRDRRPTGINGSTPVAAGAGSTPLGGRRPVVPATALDSALPTRPGGAGRAVEGVPEPGGPTTMGAATAGGDGGAFDFGMFLAAPEDHERWRRGLSRVLTPRYVEGLGPEVGNVVERLLDEVTAAPADLMTALVFPLPLEVLWLLFDVPAPLRPGFDAWARAIRTSGTSLAGLGNAVAHLRHPVRELARLALPGRGGGLLAELCRREHEDGNAVSEQWLVSTALLLTVAGYESTVARLGHGLFTLLRHPTELARVAADPDLVVPAVEEVLRHTPAGTGASGRLRTTVDVELGGVVIPEGSLVLVSPESAGRDGSRTERPDAFDPGRGSARSHLAFGSGRHSCLGAALARLTLREALGRLVRRLPRLRAASNLSEVEFDSSLAHSWPHALPVSW